MAGSKLLASSAVRPCPPSVPRFRKRPLTTLKPMAAYGPWPREAWVETNYCSPAEVYSTLSVLTQTTTDGLADETWAANGTVRHKFNDQTVECGFQT
jgi:hypothetical protein